MNNIIFKPNMNDWRETSLAKKELKFFRERNTKGQFNKAIAKEENIIRSFMDRAA